MHQRQDPKLSRHVVSRRGHRAERGAEENELARTEADQIGEIGVSSRELPDFNRSAGPFGFRKAFLRQTGPKVLLEPNKIQLFTSSDRRGIGVVIGRFVHCPALFEVFGRPLIPREICFLC